MNVASAAPVWLRQVYFVALVLHAVFVAMAIGLAIYAAAQNTADSAPPGAGLAAILVAVTLSPAIPSGFALLSWHICRRRGWAPTPGHMGLVVAAAALILVIIIVSYMS